MKTLLTCVVVVCLGLPAFGAVYNLRVTENTTMLNSPAGFNSGQVVLCEAFDVGVMTCSGSNVSDVLSFIGNAFDGYGSDPGDNNAADNAGLPAISCFGAGCRYLLEPPENTVQGVTYNPTANDPGGATNGVDTNKFVIYSDTPEPGSIALLGTGIVALAGGLRRKLML
jgi:hypothetical protein